MVFRLRYKQHDFELTEGQFAIGRSADCQLSVDDPLVSRRHALLIVTGDGVAIEDLGSRNGLQVNGKKLRGKLKLDHNDVITIGSQTLVVMRMRELATATAVRAPAPTQRADAFALLGNLAEKAFALGRGEEAERILATRLRSVLRDAEIGREISAEQSGQAADYAVRLATATGKGEWVNYIMQLYIALKRPCPTSLVDQLYEVLRKVRDVNLAYVRQYVALLQSMSDEFGPAERFLLSRVEGLERLAASR